MKTIKNPARGGYFRNLPALSLLIGAVSIFFAVSCEKGETQTDDPENFVNISISGVSDGHFTVDFQAGKNTKTIEYAVCRAVNMKADSVAFMEGSLDNIQQAVPGEDGKVSVPFDFSKPLDFGPYTVYARAISESGQASRFVKEQVCALTTGVTVEYVSRSHYRLKASYHGNEFIANAYRQSKQRILNSYGSIEGFIDYMIENNNDPTYTVFEDGDEWVERFFYYEEQYMSKVTPDDQLVGFVTSDGTKITGAYAFEIPLQEYDPSIPLPDSLEVEIDYSNPVTVIDDEYDDVTFTEKYLPVTISMGNNTDCYYQFIFGDMTTKDAFWEFFRENIVPQLNNAFQSEEDMAKFYLTGGSYYPYANLYTNDIDESESLHCTFYSATEYSDGQFHEWHYPELLIVVCPANWNNEQLLGFIEVKVPEEYLEGAGTTGMETTGMDKKVRFTAPVTYFPEISPCVAMQPAK